MQEGQNFSSYLNRFNNVDKHTVLDSREQINYPYRNFLESLYSRLDTYFNNSDFRSQIPFDIRTNVEDGYLSSTLSYLETIASWQRDGRTPINGSNIESQISMLGSNIQGFDQMIGMYYYTFNNNERYEVLNRANEHVEALMSNVANKENELSFTISNTLEQARSKSKEYEDKIKELTEYFESNVSTDISKSKNSLSEIESIAKEAGLISSGIAGNALADNYHRLANGRTIKEQSEFQAEKKERSGRLINKIGLESAMKFSFVSFVSLYLTFILITESKIQLNNWTGGALYSGLAVLSVILIVYIFISLAKVFNNNFKGGHERTAYLWMIGAIASTLFTAGYSGLLVLQMSANGSITWEEIIPKVIALLAPAYLVRLCIQNYRANSHLAVQYMHRATVMSIAEVYSKATNLDSSEKGNPDLDKASVEARMGILTEAAKIMFAQSESGYITQKEGAGSNGDNMIEVVNRGSS